MARPGYLAPASDLISIPKLQHSHGGEKIAFGSSSLTALARALVEVDFADDADWKRANGTPSAFVYGSLRRFLAENGQALIAEHFELCLTLGESIIDSAYGAHEVESEPAPCPPSNPPQLFFVLNTGSSFPLCLGRTIEELEAVHPGLGEVFYNSLRQSLYRWVRVYDDLDAGERIEQMKEWAEGEEDPDSCEIPKLEPDLPECLRGREFGANQRPRAVLSLPPIPELRRVVEVTLELERVSSAVARPNVDKDLLEQERSYHSLDSPLPVILIYFRPGDAITACFDNECEFWGQETPEPNLIVPLRPDDPNTVRSALQVIQTLMRVLVLTIEIKKVIEPEEDTCASRSMSEANSN
jgi:hypothetical protein